MRSQLVAKLLNPQTNDEKFSNIIEFFYSKFLINRNIDEIKPLYLLWKKRFKLIHGDLEGQRGIDVKNLQEYYGLDLQLTEEELLPFIFSIETYYALTLKLLAIQKLLIPNLLTEINENSSIISLFTTLESGELFKTYRINNFCIHDYFSWYLYCWDRDIEDLLRRLLTIISENFYVEQNQTKNNIDILKGYFEKLFPKDLRHPLGEYFTPNWLIELILEEIGIRDNFPNIISKKILDPTCGSGSFLIKILNELKKSSEMRVNKTNIISEMVTNIIGFEINYISTIAAKTNIVLVIGDIIKELDIPIELPVYSCDSLDIPKLSSISQQDVYSLEIFNEKFFFPSSIIKNNTLKQYLNNIENSIKAGKSLENILRQDNRIPQNILNSRFIEKLGSLYDFFNQYISYPILQFIKYAILESFKPINTKSDLIVGNPPWVGWEYIPSSYKERTKPLWKKYELYNETGIKATTLKEDISVLMTYAFADRYLNKRGKLAFVIRQAVFKSPHAGKYFRRFTIKPEDVPLEVIRVNDFTKINAFDVAINNAATILLIKGSETNFPIPYRIWSSANNSFSDDFPLKEVKSKTTIKSVFAQPLTSDSTSRWISGSLDFFSTLNKILGESQYKGRIGIFTGGANAVYYVEVLNFEKRNLVKIRNYTKGAKRKVETLDWIVERDIVYPVLKGRDIHQWKFEQKLYLLFPHTEKTLMSPITPPIMKKKFPKTYSYFLHFKKTLDKRRGFSWDKHQRDKGFYSIMRIGPYTFKKYKVAWRYISNKFTCCVIHPISISGYPDPIPPLPNDKLSFIGTDSETEAYFICGLLTSTVYRKTIEAMMVSTQISPSIINHLNIPKFDEENLYHLQISKTCKKGHFKEDKKELDDIQNRIDVLVADFLHSNC